MQSREELNGHLFVMLLSLHLYNQILEHLKRKDLLKDYSVHDVLWYLSKIYVGKLEGVRVLNEIPKGVQKLSEKLEIDILPKT